MLTPHSKFQSFYFQQTVGYSILIYILLTVVRSSAEVQKMGLRWSINQTVRYKYCYFFFWSKFVLFRYLFFGQKLFFFVQISFFWSEFFFCSDIFFLVRIFFFCSDIFEKSQSVSTIASMQRFVCSLSFLLFILRNTKKFGKYNNKLPRKFKHEFKLEEFKLM